MAFATMGMTIALCVGGGVAAGLWVDHQWGTAPAGLLVGIVLGAVVAIVSVVQQVRRYL
jgi:F0F1-type ATP synthase assembly protein I